MKPNQVKQIVQSRITELQNELEVQRARTGKNTTQLLLDDPFLAGRMYSMNMLTLDLISAMTDSEEES